MARAATRISPAVRAAVDTSADIAIATGGRGLSSVRSGNRSWAKAIRSLMMAGSFGMKRLTIVFRIDVWAKTASGAILRGVTPAGTEGLMMKAGTRTAEARVVRCWA